MKFKFVIKNNGINCKEVNPLSAVVSMKSWIIGWTYMS